MLESVLEPPVKPVKVAFSLTEAVSGEQQKKITSSQAKLFGDEQRKLREKRRVARKTEYINGRGSLIFPMADGDPWAVIDQAQPERNEHP